MKLVWRLKWMIMVLAVCLMVPMGSCSDDDDDNGNGTPTPDLTGIWTYIGDGMRQTFVVTENTIKVTIETDVFEDWLTYRLVEGNYTTDGDNMQITITRIGTPNADLTGSTYYTKDDAEWAAMLLSLEMTDEVLDFIFTVAGDKLTLKEDIDDDGEVYTKGSEAVTPVYQANWAQTFLDDEGEKKMNLTVGAVNFMMSMQFNAQVAWITVIIGEGSIDVNDELKVVTVYLTRVGVLNPQTNEMEYYEPDDPGWDDALTNGIGMPESFSLKWSVSGDELTAIIDMNGDGVYDEDGEVYTRVV
ncbi:MAG: hypothetical protein JEZ14_17925 [Marinilabiliaceae bacterium]|nr:hypothetical protein [Marinilabiliaceae bacterium]